jgi:hypothetical protein
MGNRKLKGRGKVRQDKAVHGKGRGGQGKSRGRGKARKGKAM